jgi:hypothetical protein
MSSLSLLGAAFWQTDVNGPLISDPDRVLDSIPPCIIVRGARPSTTAFMIVRATARGCPGCDALSAGGARPHNSVLRGEASGEADDI